MNGSSVYLAFIKDQLAAQEARKTSLEQRGNAVIATSGTLASLLLAFAALVVAADDSSLSSSARALVVGASCAFALAALASVGTNIPLLYAGVAADGLRGLVREKWGDDAATAEQRTAATLVNLLASAKRMNTIKGWVVFAAMSVESLAVLLLAIAVVVILT